MKNKTHPVAQLVKRTAAQKKPTTQHTPEQLEKYKAANAHFQSK